MSIAERLRELRQARRLNQEAFASVAGVTKKTQTRYETGKAKPSGDYLEALVAAGLDVVYLLTGETDPRRLPESEQELIRLWRGLSPEHQDDALRMMKAWRERDMQEGGSQRLRPSEYKSPVELACGQTENDGCRADRTVHEDSEKYTDAED